jgi:hypothetical protein|tara:strand:- start:269 stop:508 length:240 start_codon:yes stop_codon:yes gene_type:complete
MNILHVNQGNIRSNIHREPKDRLPVLRAQSDNGTLYGDSIHILSEDGDVVATIVYNPDNPLPCGARVWIETELDVAIGD